MANLTADRNTASYVSAKNQPIVGPYGLPANGLTFKGIMQSLDANKRVRNPGAVGDIVAGVSVARLDATALANDVIKTDLQTGPFKFDLHGVNPPTVADVGRLAYASDNHTISRLASDGSQAGVIIDVETDGVWVWIGGASIVPTTESGLNDAEDAITAFATGGQAGAYQLKARANRVTTVATAADSVKLPVAVPGMRVLVANNAAANSMNLFPATGAAINALGANAAFAIAANKGALLFAVTATQWVAILTA